jgi:hypothetical protein
MTMMYILRDEEIEYFIITSARSAKFWRSGTPLPLPLPMPFAPPSHLSSFRSCNCCSILLHGTVKLSVALASYLIVHLLHYFLSSSLHRARSHAQKRSLSFPHPYPADPKRWE